MLQFVIEIHSFTSKLTPNDYNKDDIISMITDCNRDIVESIDRLGRKYCC